MENNNTESIEISMIQQQQHQQRRQDPNGSDPTVPPVTTTIDEADILSRPNGKIPLAIAKLYKLTVIDDDGVVSGKSQKYDGGRGGRRNKNGYDASNHSNNRDDSQSIIYTPEQIREMELTTKQLRTEITAVFPASGAKIQRNEDSKPDKDSKTTAQYNVYNRNGELLTTYVVNKDGNVMKVVKKKTRRTDGDEDEDENNSIKLGLVSNHCFGSLIVWF